MSSNNPKLHNLLERIKQKILKIEGKDKDLETKNDSKLDENQQLKQESIIENKELNTPISGHDNPNYLDEIKNLLEQEKQLKSSDSMQEAQLQNLPTQAEEQLNLDELSRNNHSNEFILEHTEQNIADFPLDNAQNFLTQQQQQSELSEKLNLNDAYDDILLENPDNQTAKNTNAETYAESLSEESQDVFNNLNVFKKTSPQHEDDDEDLVFHYVESVNKGQQNALQEQVQNKQPQEKSQEQSFFISEDLNLNNQNIANQQESLDDNFDDEFLDDADINISEDRQDIKIDEDLKNTYDELNFKEDLSNQNQKSSPNNAEFGTSPIKQNPDVLVNDLNLNSISEEQNEDEDQDALINQDDQENSIVEESEELLSFSESAPENDTLLIQDANQQNKSSDCIDNNSITTNVNISNIATSCENIIQNDFATDRYLTQNVTLETMSNNQSIINTQTQNEVRQSLHKLHQTQQAINNANSMLSDENLAKMISDMLEPKLTEWLNNNLGSMVEQIVQEEINKLFINKK